jgi:hypothetical protein
MDPVARVISDIKSQERDGVSCICCGEKAVLKDETNDRIYCQQDCQLIYHNILPYLNVSPMTYPNELHTFILNAKQRKNKKRLTLLEAMGSKRYRVYTTTRDRYGRLRRAYNNALTNKSKDVDELLVKLKKNRGAIIALFKDTLKYSKEKKKPKSERKLIRKAFRIFKEIPIVDESKVEEIVVEQPIDVVIENEMNTNPDNVADDDDADDDDVDDENFLLCYLYNDNTYDIEYLKAYLLEYYSNDNSYDLDDFDSSWKNQLSKDQLNCTMLSKKKNCLVFSVVFGGEGVDKSETETSFLNMLKIAGATNYQDISHDVVQLEPDGTFNRRTMTTTAIKKVTQGRLLYKDSAVLYYDNGFNYASRWHLSSIMRTIGKDPMTQWARLNDVKFFVYCDIDEYGRVKNVTDESMTMLQKESNLILFTGY